MTKHFKTLVALVVLLSAISLTATTTHLASVHVPFSFVAAGKIYPAGEYRVGVSYDNYQVTLSAHNFSRILLPATWNEQFASSRSYIRFRRYGQQWFMEQVTVAGLAEHINPTKRDREILGLQPSNGEAVIGDPSTH